jgi:hypothetical protein
MRNHFEHYDERLEQWWAESPDHNIADRNVMPIDVLKFDRLGGFRQLDPNTMDVVFWGDTFNIPEIVAEAQRILPIVTKETAKPHWEP